MQQKKDWRRWRLTAMLLTTFFAVTLDLTGADDAEESPKSAAAIQQMHDEVAKLKVIVERTPQNVEAKLKQEPILRYTDPQRDFPDATLWVWTVDGRPAVVTKLERFNRNGVPQWQYCMSALNDDKVVVRWPSGIVWKSRRPGLQFHELTGLPAIPKTAPLRLAQLRAISRMFRATTKGRDEKPEEMRLLTQPIFRYSNPDQSLVDGAIFGVSSNGTNPDALLFVQVRKLAEVNEPIWEYGCLALTGDQVRIELDEKAVFEHPGSRSPGDFGHWLWVVLPSE